MVCLKRKCMFFIWYPFYLLFRVDTSSIPANRIAYYEAKSKLNPDDPNTVNELKKLLMRRAMFTIPMIHTVQNQGMLTHKLHSRGMLTDESYDRVDFNHLSQWNL